MGREGKGRKGKERKGKERKGKERKGKERKGKERKGKERKGKERKGKERKGKEREGEPRITREPNVRPTRAVSLSGHLTQNYQLCVKRDAFNFSWQLRIQYREKIS